MIEKIDLKKFFKCSLCVQIFFIQVTNRRMTVVLHQKRFLWWPLPRACTFMSLTEWTGRYTSLSGSAHGYCRSLPVGGKAGDGRSGTLSSLANSGAARPDAPSDRARGMKAWTDPLADAGGKKLRREGEVRTARKSFRSTVPRFSRSRIPDRHPRCRPHGEYAYFESTCGMLRHARSRRARLSPLLQAPSHRTSRLMELYLFSLDFLERSFASADHKCDLCVAGNASTMFQDVGRRETREHIYRGIEPCAHSRERRRRTAAINCLRGGHPSVSTPY
ncbi:hypothetical protein PUN28_002678 [Cardiocondyla obscurior]|uniref:Uncharacterized protein n=1 Tax=Cardiocondyla obscurior TaxID=286306 RepID=A0AAW2GVG3_9HYME